MSNYVGEEAEECVFDVQEGVAGGGEWLCEKVEAECSLVRRKARILGSHHKSQARIKLSSSVPYKNTARVAGR